MGKLNLPAGKKIAVNLGVDVDAQSLWLGGFNRPSPSFMSRGEFGTVVGIPRLVKLFKKYGVRSPPQCPASLPGRRKDTSQWNLQSATLSFWRPPTQGRVDIKKLGVQVEADADLFARRLAMPPAALMWPAFRQMRDDRKMPGRSSRIPAGIEQIALKLFAFSEGSFSRKT
mgnify:CR=1 FL=1